MKIRTKTFFGSSDSWAVTMRELFKQFINLNHDPYINSINGYYLMDKSWEKYINREIDDPDIDICYTAPINFETRFKINSKLKLAIFNFETNPLPQQFNDKHVHLDYVLPSSEFSKKVFLNAGYPESKLITVPHGINPTEFLNKDKVNLITDRAFKFLNVSINHYRKNIPLLVDAYYSTFNNQDDVVLIIKTRLTKQTNKKQDRFEIDVMKEIQRIQQRHNIHTLPRIELIEDRYESMVPLYNSVDALVSATSAEGFGIPLLEALAANLLVIAPRATGQLDFLNDNNSLLVDVDTISSPPQYQYWAINKKSWTYIPKKKDLQDQMYNAFKNKDSLKEKFNEERIRTINKFTWENAAKQILSI